MAHPPANLRKIGVEGFDLIDKLYGPPRRTSATDAFSGRREGTWVVQQPRNDDKEEPAVLNAKDAAAHFGGIAVVNYGNPEGKPQNRWGRADRFNGPRLNGPRRRSSASDDEMKKPAVQSGDAAVH